MGFSIFNIPIWLLLILPPVILIVLPTNFIISSTALMIGLKLTNCSQKFNIYKKHIIKIWITNISIYIMTSLVLLISKFLPKTDFIHNNITYPLSNNPFTSIYSIIYLISALLISGFIIYIINKKLILKKTEFDKKQKHIVSLTLAILTIPYIYLIPTSFIYKNINTIEKYKDTYFKDNKTIGNIINLLPSGKYYSLIKLETIEEKNQIIITYKDNEYIDIYKTIEQDATILFYLMKSVDIIQFDINDRTYEFTYFHINQFYDNKLKEKSVKTINKIYEHDNFNNYTYLGLIKQYQIFDTSESCSTNYDEIYQDDEYKYLIECSNSDKLYLIKEKQKIKIKEALNKKIIDIDDLLNTNLKIKKETL